MKGFMEINGKHATLPEGTTILDYLEQNHYVLAQIAVEHNYVILDREDYAKVVLKDDDILEIVSFMGGGCASISTPRSRSLCHSSIARASRSSPSSRVRSPSLRRSRPSLSTLHTSVCAQRCCRRPQPTSAFAGQAPTRALQL